MPINKRNQRTFHRTLYGTILETVTLYKRNPGMNASVVTKYVLFQCRWSQITKQGEPIDGDNLSDHRRTLHVPRIEMDRVGVAWFNPLDRFVDIEGRWWQPESTTQLISKLMENHWCLDCLRTDPLSMSGGYGTFMP